MDLRTPIGYLFILNGLILAAWGQFGTPTAADQAGNAFRAGASLNLGWGAAMFVFGAAMLISRYCSKGCCKKKDDAAPEEKKSCGTGCGCK